MRFGKAAQFALVLGLAFHPSIASGAQLDAKPPPLELVDSFSAGPLITGANLSGRYLYVTRVFDLLIYDVSDPLEPRLLASNYGEHLVHGELLPTNDRIALLNDWPNGNTVTVWDVENKEDPQPMSRVRPVPDEHFGCLLDCRWAYGNDGTILDLRQPSRPKALDQSWKELAGVDYYMHRVDEIRPGFLVSAPTGTGPTVIDARHPLQPRVVARGEHPLRGRLSFLYSDWSLGGEGRYLLASVERYLQRGDCGDPAATLYAYDTSDWPRDKSFERVAEYELPGSCSAYYFDFHPGFDRNGLIALPHGFEGLRLLDLDSNGFREVASFQTGGGEMWHSFWMNDEILYAFDQTGQVYILRYTD